MSRKVLVISVKPEFAKKILRGEKKIELRKNTPKVLEGDIVLIYATSPIKAIVGYCRVGGVVRDKPSNLWSRFKYQAGICKEDFNEYYANVSVGTGILLKGINQLNNNFTLNNVKEILPNFSPPQSFAYLSMADAINTYKYLS